MVILAFTVTGMLGIGVDGLFDRFRAAIARLPEGELEPSHLLTSELRLHTSRTLEIYYAPFDHLSNQARITLVGVTPGWTQMARSHEEARRALQDGADRQEVLRRAKYAASFSGSMRTNLISMLDEIGVARAIGVGSTSSLFGENADLLHPTSVIRYPVFVEGKNYSGSQPRLLSNPALLDYVEGLLSPELNSAPDSLVVPLGRSVEAALGHLVGLRELDEERCLFGFPHPSGANAHRAKQFEENRSRLVADVAAWF